MEWERPTHLTWALPRWPLAKTRGAKLLLIFCQGGHCPNLLLICRCLTRPRCLGARLEVFLREWMEMLFCPLREVHGPDRFLLLHRNRHEKVPHIPRFCTSAVTDQIQSLGATWSTSLVFSGHHQVTIRCCKDHLHGQVHPRRHLGGGLPDGAS